MIRGHKIPGLVADEIEEIAVSAVDQYAERHLSNEEGVTGYLVGRINDSLDDEFTINGEPIQVVAKGYAQTEESRTGADLGIRYRFDSEDFQIMNGVLVQSKRHDTYHENLPSQCLKLLSRSSDSFIFVYSAEGIYVVPAMTVYGDEGTGGKFKNKYYNVSISEFFERFFESFIGDQRLGKNISKPSDVVPIDDRPKFILDIQASTEGYLIEEANSLLRRDGYIRIDEYNF